jgi:hypothetical protein
MARAFNAGFSSGFGGPQNFGTLLLKIGTDAPDPRYQDGDIVCAFNRRRCRHLHANVLCHPRQAPRQSNGRIAADHISRAYLEAVHQYRFQRVSPTTVVRTNLWTGDTDVIGPTPNTQGEAMDVDAYVRRRQLAQGFGLFGAEGAEIWYGGRQRSDTTTLDAVWSAIEQHTPHREIDYADWPLGTEELKHFLAIRTDDFDDDEEQALVASVTEPNPDPEGKPILVKMRARHLPWRELRGMSAQRIAQVMDRSLPVDIRTERKHVRAVHVKVK